MLSLRHSRNLLCAVMLIVALGVSGANQPVKAGDADFSVRVLDLPLQVRSGASPRLLFTAISRVHLIWNFVGCSVNSA